MWSGKPQAPWNDDYASKGYEYFGECLKFDPGRLRVLTTRFLADVWAPEIATVYGEVFWTSQGNQPIPPGIVERFKGKTMAIVGLVLFPTGFVGCAKRVQRTEKTIDSKTAVFTSTLITVFVQVRAGPSYGEPSRPTWC